MTNVRRPRAVDGEVVCVADSGKCNLESNIQCSVNMTSHAWPVAWVHFCDSRRLVGVTEHSTVRTAQLKAFLPVHLRPINLVVYQGSHVLRQASLIFRGASHLDAFSGYPCHT